MNPKNRFWWFVTIAVLITTIIFSTLAVFFWKQLGSNERAVVATIFINNSGYIFTAVVLFMAGLAFILDGLLNTYIIPIHKLVEETTLIQSVNPSHRIEIDGSKDIIRLKDVINEGADLIEKQQREVHKMMASAKARAEGEKNLMASFMGELPEGVLMCNTEGRILLYNKKARRIFSKKGDFSSDPGSGRFVGLGRSIFGIIDKSLIVHALDEIALKLKNNETQATSYFVVRGNDERLQRVEAAPILDSGRQLTGFILIFFDITNQIETETRIDYLLQSLTRDIRTSVAGIRSAIEAIMEYPDMREAQLAEFRKIIHNEAVSLGSVLDKTSADYASYVKRHWPLATMPLSDLFQAIREKARDKIGVSLDVTPIDQETRVKVDSYLIVLTMLYVMNRLKNEVGVETFSCRFEKDEKIVSIDIYWCGESVKIEALKRWDEEQLKVGGESLPLTLKEVIKHHEAQMVCHACKGPEKESYLRFFLPAAEEIMTDGISGIIAINQESRPEFYDFDLFNQPGQTPEMDNRFLTDLTYTVFDTETTGLDPSVDEIISVGGVRIVNNRLLYEEYYDQLIDPQRPLPAESTKIHGIQPEMLRNQPTVDKVLPVFQSFAEDTVLVAHNAAFDMRMLQMKEGPCGVKFINPVIDTLLLSAVVHPAQQSHNLEAIGKRLGVRVVGRHTALGDAIATGEVFLKLIPLLSKMGIRTMKEARAASQKTFYARLKY